MKYEVTYKSGRTEAIPYKGAKQQKKIAKDLASAKEIGAVLSFRLISGKENIAKRLEGRKVPLSVMVDPTVKSKIAEQAATNSQSMSEIAAGHINAHFVTE